jgi:hypothetical protein
MGMKSKYVAMNLEAEVGVVGRPVLEVTEKDEERERGLSTGSVWMSGAKSWFPVRGAIENRGGVVGDGRSWSISDGGAGLQFLPHAFDDEHQRFEALFRHGFRTGVPEDRSSSRVVAEVGDFELIESRAFEGNAEFVERIDCIFHGLRIVR